MSILEHLTVDPRSANPIYQQLKAQLAWLLASGQIKPGELLPSVRTLSSHLGINIQTVRMAYQYLEKDGLVLTRHGLGTVAQALDLSRLEIHPGTVRSHTIGVMLPSMSNPFYQVFVEGVEQAAAADGSLLFLCCTHDDPGLALKYFRQLMAREVDGVILASCLVPGLCDADHPLPAGLPIVFADSPGSRGVNVLMDLENAGYQGTRHLIEHGHKKVGLITLNLDFDNVLPVNAGYARALDEAGIPRNDELIARVDSFQSSSGASGARGLLDLPQPPTAIFCIADMLALGAMREIRKRGLSIPGDVGIIGFNDIPLAAHSEPALTSVAAPAFDMGVESMLRLHKLIAGDPLPEREIVLPIRLVIRESCGSHHGTD